MSTLKLELKSESKKSCHALAGSNLRKELKHLFPETKFSVKTDTSSMSSSLRVSWDGLPFTKEVAPTVDKYQYADYDGMQDMSVNRKDHNSEYGEVKYAFTDHSDEGLKEEAEEVGEDENIYENDENPFMDEEPMPIMSEEVATLQSDEVEVNIAPIFGGGTKIIKAKKDEIKDSSFVTVISGDDVTVIKTGTPLNAQVVLDTKEEKKTPSEPSKTSSRRKPFTFERLGIKVGEKITLHSDKKIMLKVASEKQVEYKGETMSLSKANKELKLSGGLLSKWDFKNENLYELFIKVGA